jgi:pimeloyl-ACP methyl ester carboxylesterase
MLSRSPHTRRSLFVSLVLLALVATLAPACNHRSPAANGRGAAASKTRRPGAPAERTAASPATSAQPPVTPSGAPVAVTFPTDDGVTISATLRVGRPGSEPVVLVHQLGSARAEWEPLVAKLAEAGRTTLAIDLRGHGESTAGVPPNTRVYAYSSFTDVDWRATAKDVRAAIDFLVGRAELEATRVALVGSSIGGTACIAEAAEDPRVARLIVLSPGRAYHGFDVIMPASRLGDRPLLVVHSGEELPSGETAGVLDRIVTNATVRAATGASHGVAMFQDDATQLAAVVAFLSAP